MIYIIAFLLLFSISVHPENNEKETKKNEINRSFSPYHFLNTNAFELPSQRVFEMAFEGYKMLENTQSIASNATLTVIDFSLPSTAKRMWIIDFNSNEILFQTWVAHGKNTGENWAESFSNVSESYQSSLGFYITRERYEGKHGLSLQLEGIEPGINDLAAKRAIVLHGADYVSEAFIEQYGRLGRSFGCPAVSYETHTQIIEWIENKHVMFIYHPNYELEERCMLKASSSDFSSSASR